ncbi:MAG: hypothetical protein CVU57_03535 [Deltaproteobacteria bacterium HGW-Deltaproteobacteria-15]|jgi:acyl carrier protein|nr:MAG: hypothetical protein CVU57_03535 [Deltaproteobacteria bacterium HGW-Deltaproteobacteria-15]
MNFMGQGRVVAEELRPSPDSNFEGQESSRVSQDLAIVAIRAKVRRFMLEELAESGFHEGISDEESLLENQILDSLSILKLISFMDEGFGIYFSEEELEPERFETVNRIVELVRSKQAGR